MDQTPTIYQLFSIGLLIGCYQHLVAGLPNVHNAYHNRKIDEERPVLAMANSPRCLYNGRPVENGFKVPNPEPCLNCTCNNGMLLCYLQTCPTLVVPSKDCHVGRAEGSCCPQVRCKNLNSPYRHTSYQGGKPKHPNYKYDTSQETMSQNIQRPTTAANGATTAGTNGQYNTDHYFVGSNHKAEYSDQFYNRFRRTSRMPTSTTPESSTTSVRRRRPQPQIQIPDDQDQLDYQSGLPVEYESGANSTTGECYSKGYKYPEGMAMLSTSKCEYCYCIRGQQMCVRPKCHLNIAGCAAKYQSGFTCCPSHYECDLQANGNDGNYASIENTIRVPAENKVSSCKVDGQEFEVGVAVASRGHCQTCYCTQVGVVCRRIECSPAVEGCKPIIPEGHCCPTEYECDTPLNQTRVPVSHSTDNYDVMVISPSASTFAENEEQEEQQEGSSQATHDMYDYDEEQQESTTDKDRITVELTQDSNLESVSLIPEENLAVLVLTTEAEEEENSEQEKSTEPSYQEEEEEQQQQQETESVTPYFDYIRTRPSSLPNTEIYKTTKTTTDHTDISEKYTKYTEPNDVRDEIHTNTQTTKTEEHISTSEKNMHSTPTEIDSKISSTDEGDYYYDDYYPNDEGDYYAQDNLPVQNPIRATFSPFSEYGTPEFSDKTTIDENGSEPPSTIFHTNIFPKQTTSTSVSYSVRGQTIQQQTKPYYGDKIEEFEKHTQQPTEDVENDISPTENANEYNTIHDKTETEPVISEKYPSTKEKTQPTYFADEYQTKTTQTNQQQQDVQSQETAIPNKLDTDPTSTTQKRTMYTSLSTQTIPPSVTTEMPTEKNAYVYTETEENTESTVTQKTEVEEYDQPSSVKSDALYRTSTNQETDQPGLSQKRYTNTVPVDIAELIWAITNAQAVEGNKTEQTDTTFPDIGTTPHDTPSPSAPEKEQPSQSHAFAAPKLIIEETTTKENDEEEKEIPSNSSGTTDGTLFKYKSPLVIFSNHGPSAPIRPLSSLQPGIPAVVNNHKVVSNHAPARRKPYRPLSSSTTPLPSTPAVEFSNHRPTHTLRRPPALKGQSRPGMVMKLGVHKTHRPTDGSFKNHRIVSDSVPSSDNPSEPREETDDAEYQYSEDEIGKATKDFPNNYFEAKPVSVSLTIDHKAQPYRPENASNTSEPQTPNIPSNGESKDTGLKEIITKNIEESKPFIRNENVEDNKSSETEIIKEESQNKHDISNPSVDFDFKLNHTQGQSLEQNTGNSKAVSVDDGKLSRADDETHSKGLESPFVDRRLTSYVGSPLQRLPEIRPKLPNLEPPQVPLILSEEEEKQEITDVCFVDGRYYKSGEVIVKTNPCEMCRCFYGYPLCQVQQCPNPPDPTCMLEYLPGYCCPRVTCGVKSDDAKPPIEMSQPDIPLRSQTSSPSPFPVADNQWKPLPNAYPQHSKKEAESNIMANKDKNVDPLVINHSVNTLEKTPMVTFKQTETNDVPNVSHIEKSSPNEEKAITIDFTTAPPPITAVSPTVPKPVFKPAENKDNSSSIHDNSSGVRKILNETVVLPASKVSLSPAHASDVTVLPLVHEMSTAAPTVQPSTSEAIMNNELKEFTVELGGNLKVSGCNVYGQYYKINDRVAALSKNCTECVCSADGISCNEIC